MFHIATVLASIYLLFTPCLAVELEVAQRCVKVNGQCWLELMKPRLYMFGKWADADSGDLKAVDDSDDGELGEDSVGQYLMWSTSWHAIHWPPSGPHFVTSLRLYMDVPLLVFSQSYPRGAAGCADLNQDELRSVYPRFKRRGERSSSGVLQPGDIAPRLGFFTFSGVFMHNQTGGHFSGGKQEQLDPLPSGVEAGPIILFQGDGLVSGILSPFSEFMTASVTSSAHGELGYGPMGSLCDLPPGYRVETALHVGDKGVVPTVLAWGKTMMRAYGTNRANGDVTLQTLGYSTDNGAYYYYVHEPGLPDMQATLLEVHRYATNERIPYRHALIDSYFYPHGLMNGVKNWTVRPDVFPDGLAALASATSWSLQAHNRYWSPDTDYAAPVPPRSAVGGRSGGTSRDVNKKGNVGAIRTGVRAGGGEGWVAGVDSQGKMEAGKEAASVLANKGQVDGVVGGHVINGGGGDGMGPEDKHGATQGTSNSRARGGEGNGEGDGEGNVEGDGEGNGEGDGEGMTYKFVMDEEHPPRTALPLERRFWDDLFMGSARPWGVAVYEQDWLNVQFLNLSAAARQPGLMRTWMLQMGDAATSAGLTIQYCMPLARHVLGSLEVPAVTQARATVDYPDSDDQWQVAPSALLLWALGLAPSKDTAWSTALQPGNRYNRTEPFPDLQTAVLALSGGPVAYSDRIGHSTRWRILRTCREDGALLQPARPLMPIYPWFLRQGGFAEGAVQGEVYEAIMRPLSDVTGDVEQEERWGRAQRSRGPAWHAILAVDVKQPFTLLPRHLTECTVTGVDEPREASSRTATPPSTSPATTPPRKMVSGRPSSDPALPQPMPPSRLPPPLSEVAHIAYSYRVSGEDGSISDLLVQSFSHDHPIQLAPCGRADFALWHVAPVLRGGWFVLGELAKAVPIAPRRIVAVDLMGADTGFPGKIRPDFPAQPKHEEAMSDILSQPTGASNPSMLEMQQSRLKSLVKQRGLTTEAREMHPIPVPLITDAQHDGEGSVAAEPVLMLTLEGAPAEMTSIHVGHVKVQSTPEASEEDLFLVKPISVKFPDDGRLFLCIDMHCDEKGTCALLQVKCHLDDAIALY